VTRLHEDYLRYAGRRHGMDHDRYPWSNLFERKPVSWPDDCRVAFFPVLALEWFPLNSSNRPFRPPGGMVTPYPDLRHYSSRDYGNRVAVFRLMELFDRMGTRPACAVNSDVARRYPFLVQQVVQRDWEVIAHGVNMDTLHYGGMSREAERKQIEQALATLREATGKAVRGWLSPAKNQSEHTLDLLAEAGLDYCCDWVNDDMPLRMESSHGPIYAMPHSNELCDRQIIIDYRHTEWDFVQQVKDQCECLCRESQRYGGRILSLVLHPWVIGQPYRVGFLQELLEWLAAREGIWYASGSDILDCWLRQQ